MKKLILLLFLVPVLIVANEKTVPSKIKEVTVYLSGAQIHRKAKCTLKAGKNELVFTGLSAKIDESSLQISGLGSASILSMSYDLDYLSELEGNPKVKDWENQIVSLQHEIALYKNLIIGLEEEEKIITTNRVVSSENQALDLTKIKEIGTYYRERITAIKNEIFQTNLKINEANLEIGNLRKQLQEVNNASETEQGELTLILDAPLHMNLELSLSYLVSDAGWIPNYDIKSEKLNAPIKLAYKAHVYQKTGNHWDNVNITLSAGNPNVNVTKPDLGTQYLNFTNRNSRGRTGTVKKNIYPYNPTVKTVTGTVIDQTGLPLPGANVIVKGTNNGTQTDFDGNFSLQVGEGREIVISYIGQVSQELPIYSSVMNIQMEEDYQALEEVVVVGYGTSDASSNVRVRDYSSTPKVQPPLYIIDGVPVTNYNEGDLDGNEIQSMEVLNGAEATAIYGNRGASGIVVITTRQNSIRDDLTNTKFSIRKPYSIVSDGDITAIQIDSFKLSAEYEFFAAPIINENVFLTATMQDWEKLQLLPGEANIYYEGGYAGKTTLNPFTVKKELTLSLGIDPNITVTRKQQRNFKSKSFTGSNRVLNRTYDLEVKNNKTLAIDLKLMDRIPISQNKDIKVSDVDPMSAEYETKTGLLTWKIKLDSEESQKESFSFQVKYPKGRYISL
ncbi:mucoidy inhibitor MuiA family protein [Flagellimonas sp. S174]|uniref:mucoidy inhibitor MuiA family protein n=1 Tax=Flagellimonas sp. S174 TaxID=3410790 RepID=UPI003BF57430